MTHLAHLWLSAVALVSATSVASAELLSPLNTDPTILLHHSVTSNMMADWSSTELQPMEQPDRSFRNMWVRLFPLLSQPLGDPYPETQNLNELFIENNEGLKVYGLDDGALLFTGTVLQFDFARRQVKVNGRVFPLEPLWVVPEGGLTLTQWDKDRTLPNGKKAEVRVRARGGFIVRESRHVPRDDSAPRMLWSCINVVSVNDYLRSVVPSEVIASWKPETLKAQAIAARTYGLYEATVARQAGRDFDVDPSTWYQSYQGARFWNRETRVYKDVELSSTNNAVAATGSKVILHRGSLIRAFFSANSGGRTCTTAECMESGNNLPYIREVDDAPGVRSSPGGTWGSRATLTRTTIKDRLVSLGIAVPAPVSKLEHLERGVSGRTWRLRVLLQNGSSIDLSREHTRKIMHLFGPIRSFHYELGTMNSAGRQSIRGYGYGHAVGMSQWGAQLYAKAGWGAERILQHFFYNVTIAPLSVETP